MENVPAQLFGQQFLVILLAVHSNIDVRFKRKSNFSVPAN